MLQFHPFIWHLNLHLHYMPVMVSDWSLKWHSVRPCSAELPGNIWFTSGYNVHYKCVRAEVPLHVRRLYNRRWSIWVGGIGGSEPVGRRRSISWLMMIHITSKKRKKKMIKKAHTSSSPFTPNKDHQRDAVTSSKHQNFTGLSEVWQLSLTVT